MRYLALIGILSVVNACSQKSLSTSELLERGDAKACLSKEAHRDVIGALMPLEQKQITGDPYFRDHNANAEKYNKALKRFSISLENVTAGNVSSSEKRASCYAEAVLSVDGKKVNASRAVSFELREMLDKPGTVGTYGNFATAAEAMRLSMNAYGL
jgi:hypothetical protein